MSKRHDEKYQKPSLGSKLGGIENADVEFARKFFRFYFSVLYKRMQTKEQTKGSTKEQLKWIREAKPTYEEYKFLQQKFPDVWAMEARRHGLTGTEIKLLQYIDEQTSKLSEVPQVQDEELNFLHEKV